MSFADVVSWWPLSLFVGGLVFCMTFIPLKPSLHQFPGPFLARWSFLWLTRQCRLAQRSASVMMEHKKHGDFVRIAPNHISCSNPQAIHEIYSHKAGFEKSAFYDAFFQVRAVVFNARDVGEHQRKRKYLNPAFSARALSEFEPHMDSNMQRWKLQLLSMCDGNKGTARVDFVEWTNYLAFDVIGDFAFGRPFGFVEKGHDPYNLISTIDARGEVLNALGTIPSWIRPWMKYYFLDPFWYSGLRAASNLAKIGKDAYLARKAEASPRKDLLSYLFNAKSPETGEVLPEEEIIAEAISFIVGGSDTTSSTMANFIDFVSRDPALQQKLFEEIETTFPEPRDPTWIPPDSDLVTMQFLNATLREVMRVRPTSATGLERVVPVGGRQISGRYIPGGTIVSVPTCNLMQDGRIFCDPHKFDPDRWLQPGSEKLLNQFFPFSTGPRACIGRNFAWSEILKAVVIVLRWFELERATKEPTVIREGFFQKSAECKVILKQRGLR